MTKFKRKYQNGGNVSSKKEEVLKRWNSLSDEKLKFMMDNSLNHSNAVPKLGQEEINSIIGILEKRKKNPSMVGQYQQPLDIFANGGKLTPEQEKLKADMRAYNDERMQNYLADNSSLSTPSFRPDIHSPFMDNLSKWESQNIPDNIKYGLEGQRFFDNLTGIYSDMKKKSKAKGFGNGGNMSDEQYAQNVDDYIERGFDGNPVTDASKRKPNYAGYANAGLGVASSISSLNQINKTPMSDEQRNQANASTINSAVDTVAGAVTPWYTAAKMGSGVARSFIDKDETGKANSAEAQALDSLFTAGHESAINSASEGDWGGFAGNLIAPGLYGALTSYRDYGYGGRMRNKNYCEDGGYLTQFQGNTHENGGIALGENNEVETGETRGPANMPNLKDYIYSDRLKVPNKKITFAQMSKKIENKFSKRPNDKMSQEQKERELSDIMNSQESVRENMMRKAHKKAYGTHTMPNGTIMNDSEMYANGGLIDPPSKIDSIDRFNTELGNYNKINIKKVPGNIADYVGTNLTPSLKTYNQTLDNALRTKYNLKPEDVITSKHQLSYDESNKALQGKYNDYLSNYNAYNTYRGKTELEPRKSPQPSVASFDYVQPKPVYDSVKSNLFTKYPTVSNIQVRAYGGNMGKRKYQNGSYLEPMEEPIDPSFDYYTANKASMDEYSNMVDDYLNQGLIEPSNQSYNGNPVIAQNNKRQRNFDPNDLYGLGNFAGGLYDIGRGLKGGDDVNFERVNPDLVDYKTSRDLTRRDIKQGFAGDREIFKNVNNPAQYLSMITQRAGQRDKAISDAIAKSVENEQNINAQIRNQAKQFNAQTQKEEADARQREADIASNMVQAGLSSVGSALAGTGRDKKAYVSQETAKQFIGSAEYSPIYDKKGKISAYKYKPTGQIYQIQ